MREPGSLSLTDRDFSARSEQTETAMFTNPYLANEFARLRQSEILAHAEQHRLVRQLRDIARA
jgi:hypothetical protein